MTGSSSCLFTLRHEEDLIRGSEGTNDSHKSNFTGTEQPTLPWPLFSTLLVSFLSFSLLHLRFSLSLSLSPPSLCASLSLSLSVGSSPPRELSFPSSYKTLSGYFLQRYETCTSSDENALWPSLGTQPVLTANGRRQRTCRHHVHLRVHRALNVARDRDNISYLCWLETTWRSSRRNTVAADIVVTRQNVKLTTRSRWEGFVRDIARVCMRRSVRIADIISDDDDVIPVARKTFKFIR